MEIHPQMTILPVGIQSINQIYKNRNQCKIAISMERSIEVMRVTQVEILNVFQSTILSRIQPQEDITVWTHQGSKSSISKKYLTSHYKQDHLKIKGVQNITIIIALSCHLNTFIQ